MNQAGGKMLVAVVVVKEEMLLMLFLLFHFCHLCLFSFLSRITVINSIFIPIHHYISGALQPTPKSSENYNLFLVLAPEDVATLL